MTAPRATVEEAVRRILVMHGRQPDDLHPGALARCICTASVLNHHAHVAAKITDLLDKLGMTQPEE